MASIIYDSLLGDLSSGAVSQGDTFYAMLVTSSYVPNKGTHAKRSDVTNEASGAGYVAGGQAVTVTPALDTSLHKLTWTLSSVSWASSTISAAACVIYKHRGGAASADNLVAYVDDAGTVTDTNGTWTQTFSTPLTIQN